MSRTISPSTTPEGAILTGATVRWGLSQWLEAYPSGHWPGHPRPGRPTGFTSTPPTEHHHMGITPPEAALLAALLRPRVAALSELLAAQVQALPPGDDSWADTQEALETAKALLSKAEAIR